MFAVQSASVCVRGRVYIRGGVVRTKRWRSITYPAVCVDTLNTFALLMLLLMLMLMLLSLSLVLFF